MAPNNTTPSKQAQESEARERAERGARGEAGFRGDPEGAAHTIEADDADLARVPVGESEERPDPSDPPQPRVFQPNARDAIVARYRESRDADTVELDHNDAMLPEEMRTARTQPEPELPEDEEEQPKPADPTPIKRTLIVRGEKREYTEEEIAEIAQRALAANSYTDEALQTARQTLDEAKRLRAETSAQRGGATGTHPAGDTTQPAEPDPSAPPAGDDELDAAITALQYGEPEAKDKLRGVITTLATKVATDASSNALRQRLFQEDADSGTAAIAKFAADNADVVADEIARGAIETAMYQVQREDLEKVGYTADKLKEMHGGRAPTAREISILHQQGRVERVPGMRNHADMLNEAHDRYKKHLESRGVRTADPPAERQESQPSTTQPPRRTTVAPGLIESRDGRRAAIPQSPRSTPAAATMRPEPPKAPAKREAGDIVAEMAASRRKQPVGIRPGGAR